MFIHKDLEVYKKAIDLVEVVYGLTKVFPEEEKFGLTSQVRRAVVSIPANLSEGCSRESAKDTLRFLNISSASLSELDTLLIICKRLDYLSIEEYEEAYEKMNQVSKLLLGYIKYVRSKL